MIHPSTKIQFISETVGVGIVATEFIPKGTIVWSIDKLDQVFSPDRMAALQPYYQELVILYGYRTEDGDFVLPWDNTKHVNHSSFSNILTTAHQYEIAVRDIHPGEQLFNDYGYHNLPDPEVVVPETGSDRDIIYATDVLKYHGEWDAQLKDAFKYLESVKQPLQYLLEDRKPVKFITDAENLWEDALRVAREEKEMESILLNYFPDPIYHNVQEN